MAQLQIQTGASPNDGTGDSIRDAFIKTQSNFSELYSNVGSLTTSTLLVQNSLTQIVSQFSDLSQQVSISTSTSREYVDYSTSLVYTAILNEIGGATALQGAVTALENSATIAFSRLSTVESSLTNTVNRLGILETSSTIAFGRLALIDNTLTLKANQSDVISLIISSTASLATRVQQLQTDFSTPGSVTGVSYTGITSLVSNSTASIGTRLTTLEASFTNYVSGGGASISYVDTVVASSTASLSSSVQQLKTDFSTPGNLTGAGYTGLTSLVSNSTGSFATRVTNLETSVSNIIAGGAGASISYVDNVVAASTFTLAQSVQTLSTNVGGLSTSVTNFASTINGIEGQFGVTINANGQITGYKAIGSPTTSSFIINANEFRVTGDGFASPTSVFSVDTVNQVIRMKSNVFVDGTIASGSSATNGVFITPEGIKIYSGGILRVHIGNLSA